MKVKRILTNTNREHLYRCHAQQSLSCPRCVASFDKQESLDEHLLLEERCQVANRKDGIQQTISPAQVDKLRRRKGLYGQSDLQKWYEIWEILFPTHQRPTSPCKFWNFNSHIFLFSFCMILCHSVAISQRLCAEMNNRTQKMRVKKFLV